MATPVENTAALLTALGVGGIAAKLIEVWRAARVDRRAEAAKAAAAVAAEPAALTQGNAEFQRTLIEGYETLLKAHGIDFKFLRKRLEELEAKVEECDARHEDCLRENRQLQERVGVLEVARGLAPYTSGQR